MATNLRHRWNGPPGIVIVGCLITAGSALILGAALELLLHDMPAAAWISVAISFSISYTALLLLARNGLRRRLNDVQRIAQSAAAEREERRLSETVGCMAGALGGAIELRDKELAGHTERVTGLTLALARRLGWDENALRDTRHGCLLHDLGKLGIPEAILLKPSPLTDDERKVMQRHPQLAYDLLRDVPYLEPALAIPYCHHERWDGGGYPRGLKGEEIPLPARVFSVVDVFDALTSERPYRTAWTSDYALEYIAGKAARHFDPEVVKLFLDEMAAARGQR